MKNSSPFYHSSYIRQAFGVWLATSLFYAFQFFLRSSPNAMSDFLKQDFGISTTQLGFFTAVYYVPYVMLQIPLGAAMDLWGPKKVLRLGSLVCVFGAIIFALSHGLTMALIGRMLIGMGASAAFIGSIRMSTLWIPSAYLAFSIGLLSALGKLGGATAHITLPQLLRWSGDWHTIMYALCVIGFVLMSVVWLVGKNGPQDHFEGVKSGSDWSTVGKQMAQVAKHPIIWCMGIYGYSMYLVLSVFSDAYSIKFLSLSLGINQIDAGKLSAWAPIGSAIGASLITFCSDYFQRRRIFLKMCSWMTLIMGSWIFFATPSTPMILIVCLFLLGLFSSGQILIFAVVAETFPKKLTGIATGMTNAIMMMGGVLHNPLVGKIIGRGLYISDYRWGFASLISCFFLASVIGMFIKETHPHHTSNQNIGPVDL